MFGRIVGQVAALVVLSCIGMATADAASTEAEFGKVFDDLGVTLPADIVRRPQVLQRLETLRREPCDQTAIVELAQALDGIGYRRQGRRGACRLLRQLQRVSRRLTTGDQHSAEAQRSRPRRGHRQRANHA